MRDIRTWLTRFRTRWKNRDVDGVLDLFAKDVDYHETPFQKLQTRGDIRSEWESVKDQHDIEIDTEVFVSNGARHAVEYKLRYTKSGEVRQLTGVYLVELNEANECTEFTQYFQTRRNH